MLVIFNPDQNGNHSHYVQYIVKIKKGNSIQKYHKFSQYRDISGDCIGHLGWCLLTNIFDITNGQRNFDKNHTYLSAYYRVFWWSNKTSSSGMYVLETSWKIKDFFQEIESLWHNLKYASWYKRSKAKLPFDLLSQSFDRKLRRVWIRLTTNV